MPNEPALQGQIHFCFSNNVQYFFSQVIGRIPYSTSDINVLCLTVLLQFCYLGQKRTVTEQQGTLVFSHTLKLDFLKNKAMGPTGHVSPELLGVPCIVSVSKPPYLHFHFYLSLLSAITISWVGSQKNICTGTSTQ